MQDPSLALHRALQLYRKEAPQPPGHLVTGKVLRTAIKETLYILHITHISEYAYGHYEDSDHRA